MSREMKTPRAADFDPTSLSSTQLKDRGIVHARVRSWTSSAGACTILAAFLAAANDRRYCLDPRGAELSAGQASLQLSEHRRRMIEVASTIQQHSLQGRCPRHKVEG